MLSSERVFVQIGDTGSLSRAAEALNLSISAASRYRVVLETGLGVRLVQRTTRRLHLTEARFEFHRRRKAVLAEMREAEQTVTEAVIKPAELL